MKKNNTKTGGNTLVISTNDARANRGETKCQHCEKWTPNKGADLSFEWLITGAGGEAHKTTVVIALCVPCANLYNNLPLFGKSAFNAQCKANTMRSIGGGAKYAGNRN